MKRELIVSIIVVFFTLNLFGAGIELTKEEKEYLKNNPVITVGYSNDFQPNYIANKGLVSGIIPDIYEIIAKEYGVEFKYVTKNWKDVIQETKEGKLDVIPIMNKKIAKQNGLLTTKGTYLHLFKAYGKKEKNYTIGSIEELKGLRVTYVKNVLILDKFLEDYKNKFQVIQSDNPLDALEKVSNGDADVAIMLNITADYLLNQVVIKDIEAILTIDKLRPMSVSGIRPDRPILKSILDKMETTISFRDRLEIVNRWTKPTLVTSRQNENLLTDEEIGYLKEKVFTIYYTAKGWYPFVFFEDNSMQGISVDIWDQLTQKLNIDYAYMPIESFAEILKLSKNDRFALQTSTSATKDRKEYAAFTKPYASFPIAIATNIEEGFILDLEELEGKKVAVGENYSAHKLLQDHYPKIDFVLTKNTQESLKKLTDGEVFAAADILPVLNYELNKNHFTNIKISGTSKFSFDVQIMVNKHNEKMIPILNKLIDNMDQNKKQNIINRWLQTTKIEKVDYTLAYWVAIISVVIIAFILYRQNILKKQKKQIELEVQKATKELKELNIIHEDTQHLAKIATMKKDLNSGEYWVSKEFYHIYEFDQKEVVTTELINSRIDLEDQNKLLNFFKKNEYYQDKISNEDSLIIKLVFPDKIKYIEIYLSYIFDANKQPKERQATIQDITEKVLSKNEKEKHEAILIQQSKLASMGEMIGAIAHQWRQPLNELGIRIQKLKYKYASDQIDEQYIEKFVEQNKQTINFMSKTIDDFRNFFRIDKNKRDFHIKESIDDVKSILSAQLNNHFIVVNYDQGDFVYNGYKTEFQQVLINLISNAKDAFISNNIKNPIIDIKVQKDTIILEDNAGGISQDVIDRVFEPYFTTKEQGEGTGMGLYMSKMIIEDNMNGKISVENKDDGLQVIIKFEV